MIFGLVGWITTSEICRVLSSPRCDHVFPASIDLYTPFPIDVMTPLAACSPIPTTTILGSLSATAIAPTEPVLKNPSEIFFQVIPSSVVLKTPPPVEPI